MGVPKCAGVDISGSVDAVASPFALPYPRTPVPPLEPTLATACPGLASPVVPRRSTPLCGAGVDVVKSGKSARLFRAKTGFFGTELERCAARGANRVKACQVQS